MSFICKQIGRLSHNFESVLIKRLNSDFFKYTKPDLFHLTHIYNNLKLINFISVEKMNIEKILLENISNQLHIRYNFGNDLLFNILKIFSGYYLEDKHPEYKEIIIKTINAMNENPEMIKDQHLEDTIKILSSKQMLDIKQSINKVNLFKKISTKLEQGNKNGLMGLKTKKYKVNVDIENNLIVFSDKDENHIVFVELTHNQKSSINLYQSLIKSMKPEQIFIDIEPYIYEKTNIDELNDIKLFKEIIKSKNNNLTVRGENIYNLEKKIYEEVESVIYYSLLNKKKVNLLDSNYSYYTKSFLDTFDTDKLNDFKNYLSVINIIEIISWIKVQEKIGCKLCANFLNKKDISLEPLHPEYLFKNSLPNYDTILKYKANRISKKINNNPGNIMIFSSNINELAQMLLKIDDEKDNIINENYSILTSDMVAENFDLITLSLILKESSKNIKFYDKPPFNINIEDNQMNEFRKNYLKNFKQIYSLDELDDFEKENKCEPLNYVSNLISESISIRDSIKQSI